MNMALPQTGGASTAPCANGQMPAECPKQGGLAAARRALQQYRVARRRTQREAAEQRGAARQCQCQVVRLEGVTGCY